VCIETLEQNGCGEYVSPPVQSMSDWPARESGTPVRSEKAIPEIIATTAGRVCKQAM
jgi:hypothetical protein